MNATWLSGENPVLFGNELAFKLDDLCIEVGDGWLSSANTESREIFASEGDLAALYVWRIAGRSFKGLLNVKREQEGYVQSLRIYPEDGGSWSFVQSNEGSGKIVGWKQTDGVRLFHADNLRGSSQGVLITEGEYSIPMSRWKNPVNSGRWQSFPGLWLNQACGVAEGFVCGVLSQQAFKHSCIGAILSPTEIALRASVKTPGIDRKVFHEGEEYCGEALYFEIGNHPSFSQAYRGYVFALERRLRPIHDRSALRSGPYWGSWNDRRPYFWDVSMELLRRTAPVLRQKFPAVLSMEVDDGYAFAGFTEVDADIWTNFEHGQNPENRGKIKRVRRLGAGFSGEPDQALARDRFPDGMRAASDQIRRDGFLPAIWLGLDIVRDAALTVNHPDWFIEYKQLEGDDPELANVFSGNSPNRTYVLDPSQVQVRNYIRELLETLLGRWGFRALKLDFWSYAFENDGFRLKCPSRTAYELRRWMFESIREYLPFKSYLLTACDISTGNPFLCEWVDSVRYGIDIGNGKWENIRYSALVGTFLFGVGIHRFYLLNPDSVGLLPSLPKNERLCFWAWCAVTRSLLEVAGDLALADRADLAPLQRLLRAPKNGAEVRIGHTNYVNENEPAAVVFSPGDLFSCDLEHEILPAGVLGVFNWSDQERSVSVSNRTLGLDEHVRYLDSNLFSDTDVIERGEEWMVSLPPRSVRISHLSLSDQISVVNSSVVIIGVHEIPGGIKLVLDGDADDGIIVNWPGMDTETEITLCGKQTVTVTKLGGTLFKLMPASANEGSQHWEILLPYIITRGPSINENKN